MRPHRGTAFQAGAGCELIEQGSWELGAGNGQTDRCGPDSSSHVRPHPELPVHLPSGVSAVIRESVCLRGAQGRSSVHAISSLLAESARPSPHTSSRKRLCWAHPLQAVARDSSLTDVRGSEVENAGLRVHGVGLPLLFPILFHGTMDRTRTAILATQQTVSPRCSGQHSPW